MANKKITELMAGTPTRDSLIESATDVGGTTVSRKFKVGAVVDLNNVQIASEYDDTATYAYGAYCIKDGVLYRCTTAISVAEAWDSTHWTAVMVTGEYKRVRIMNKAAFDLLSADEKDGFIYVSDYPTKIQDIDNVNLNTSDNNKLLGVSVSGSDISVGAVSSLFKVIAFNLASCTVNANSVRALRGNEFTDTTDIIPTGFSPIAISGEYNTNNNIKFVKVEATQAGGAGVFVTLGNDTASNQTGYIQVKILYIKNSLL